MTYGKAWTEVRDGGLAGLRIRPHATALKLLSRLQRLCVRVSVIYMPLGGMRQTKDRSVVVHYR
jgi:hypothetical protein